MATQTTEGRRTFTMPVDEIEAAIARLAADLGSDGRDDDRSALDTVDPNDVRVLLAYAQRGLKGGRELLASVEVTA